jgi:hypothetical protein
MPLCEVHLGKAKVVSLQQARDIRGSLALSAARHYLKGTLLVAEVRKHRSLTCAAQ